MTRAETKECTVVTCEREALYERRTLCVTHYGRKKRTGDVQADVPIREKVRAARPVNKIDGDLCAVDDCMRLRAKMRGGRRRYCSGHVARLNKTGRLDVHIPLRVLHSGNLAEWCSYKTAHRRVSDRRGRAADQQCVTCGKPAIDWAYRGDAEHEFSGQFEGSAGIRRWSGDPADYDAMCRSCHIASDRTLEARDRRATDVRENQDVLDKDFLIAQLRSEIGHLKATIAVLQDRSRA